MAHSEDDDAEATEQMVATEMTDPGSKMQDKYSLTHILFYAMGMVTLVSSNFFTTATDYWMYKFREDTSSDTYNPNNRTALQAQFTSTYSIVSHVSSILFIMITIRLAKYIDIKKRLFSGIAVILVMFTLTVIFVKMDTDSWQKGFFVLTLIIGVFLTGSSSMFMMSLFQLSAKFPPTYLATILSGQAICGIFSALVQIFALSIGASSQTTGLVYFLIGMFFIFATLVYFVAVTRTCEFYKYHFSKEVEANRSVKITKELFLRVLFKIKYYLLSMVLCMGGTVLINPGVTALVVSVGKGNGNQWNDLYFVPVITFLCYNTFDFIGRELAHKFRQPSNGIFILIASTCRIAFVPLIIFCNVQPRHLPVAFNDDAYYIIFMIIFAISNGYLTNLCVIQIPSATEPEERVLATLLIVVVMITSLGLVSFLTPVIVNSL